MSIQHGIRAVPHEGTRFRAPSSLLSKDNYTAWSSKMKASLLVHEVWDIVSGMRIRPTPAPALVFGEGGTNQDAIDAANRSIDDFQKSYNRAALLIAESISDSEILSVTSVLENPVATWNKLQQKFARRSQMGQEAAHMALLHFQHMETETADDTITRYEAIIEKCTQQGVAVDDLLLERMILLEPNDRYMYLKKSYQHSMVKQDLQAIFSAMRDDDAEYQKKNVHPTPGSAAFAEAVKIEAEILWAQRNRETRPAGSRSAPSYTTCYCCGEKGHYAKDCQHAGAKCKFCKKTGHMEKACRQKKQQSEGGPSGEASFFHGGHTARRFSDCDSHHGSKVSEPDGESMLGELSTIDISGAEVLISDSLSSTSSTFLGDSGASHHICHKKELFTELSPIPGQFKISQVQGTVDVTHW